MTGRKRQRGTSVGEGRAELAARLRRQASRIELAILERLAGLPGSAVNRDPAYAGGAQVVVAEVVAYRLASLEKGVEVPLQIPVEVARRVRRAARDGVSLEAVLRRCIASSRSFEEFVLIAAEGIPNRVICQILSEQAVHDDRLMELVLGEYKDELTNCECSSVERRTLRVLRFLEDSSRVCPADVGYDFDGWHTGMIVVGRTEAFVRALGLAVERWACQLLSVPRDPDVLWVWLGRRTPLDVEALAEFFGEGMDGTCVALGESRQGLDGWRLTFREAQRAREVMFYRAQPVTRCRDVILESAVLRDPPLATSLIETYLTPLEGRSDSGRVLRETLRMYFHKDQNAKSAAAALGVARHTVERRLRRVEERLGQKLDACSAQMQVALGAEELLACTPREAGARLGPIDTNSA